MATVSEKTGSGPRKTAAEAAPMLSALAIVAAWVLATAVVLGGTYLRVMAATSSAVPFWRLAALTLGGLGLLLLTAFLRRFLSARAHISALLALAAAILFAHAARLGQAPAWLAAAGVFLLGWLVGAALLPWFRVSLRPELRYFLQTVLGLQTVSLLGLLWSLLRIWSVPLEIGSSLALAGLSFLLLRRFRLSQPTSRAPAAPPLSLVECLAAAFLLGVLALVGGQASLPEVGFDALFQHLVIAQDIARNHYIPDTALWHTLVPHGYHMLLGLALSLGGLQAATFAHGLFGMLAGLGTIAFGAVLYCRKAGLIAAALVTAAPLVLWEQGTAMADLAAMAYGLAFAVCLYHLAISPSPGWAALTGAILGMNAAIRYFGFLLLPALLLVLALLLLRPTTRRQGWIAFAASAAAFLGTAGPWIARTWLLTGNPIFPLMGWIFHSPYWGTNNFNFNFNLFGLPCTPLNILLTPYWVTVHTHRFVEGTDGIAGGLLLLVWPLLLLWPSAFSRGRWLLPITALLFMAPQWMVVQCVRYTLVVWPLLALSAAGALVTASAWPGAPRPLVWSAGLGVAAVCALGVLGWLLPGVWPNMDFYEVLHPTDRRAYLARQVPGYATMCYAAAHLPLDERILGTEGAFAGAYAQRHIVPHWSPVLRDEITLIRAGTSWAVDRADPDLLATRHGIHRIIGRADRATRLAARTSGPAAFIPEYSDGAWTLLRIEPRR